MQGPLTATGSLRRRGLIGIGVLALLALALVTLPARSGATSGANGNLTWSFSDASGDAITNNAFGGGNQTTIQSCSATAKYCPAWSGVTYSQNATKMLWVITTTAGHMVIVKTGPLGTGQRVTVDHPNESDSEPSFSPNGRYLTYVRQFDGSSLHSIVTSNLAGGQITSVSKDFSGSDPEWSPNGRTIIFEHNSTVWSIPAKGGNRTPIIPNGEYASWSSNGREIIYSGFDSTNIFIAHANGSHRQQVAIGCSSCQSGAKTWPVFSPDGSEIAFATTNNDGSLGLYTVPAHGGAATRVGSTPAQSGSGADTTGLAWARATS